MRTNAPRERPTSAGDRGAPSATTSKRTAALDALAGRSGRCVIPDSGWRDISATLKLSSREAEIVQALFDDEKESSIGAALGISTHTVHSHIERLYRKLHVSSRVTLVVRVFVEYLDQA